MKSMRDYINLVEAAMQESKNKQSYEHHRDMAKLDTGPGRKDIHNALANKYGKRMDDEKKTQKPQGVAEGFNDSSKDYGTDEVTITFDGDIPSKEEIIQYCKKNYGFVPSSIDIEPPSDFRGMSNPGIIRVKQGVAEEQLEETSPEAIAKIDQITRK